MNRENGLCAKRRGAESPSDQRPVQAGLLHVTTDASYDLLKQCKWGYINNERAIIKFFSISFKRE